MSEFIATQAHIIRLWDMALDHRQRCIDGLQHLARVLAFIQPMLLNPAHYVTWKT